MSEERWIDPSGTGRAGLVDARIPAEWVEAAAAVDLDIADVALAFELVGWLPPDQQDARLAGLIAALRLAHARGSTRLPLEGPVLDAHLQDLAVGDVRHAAERLLESADAFSPLSGGAESRCPLVVRRGYLFSRRLYVLEQRVAAGIRARRVPRTVNLASHKRAMADVVAVPPTLGKRDLRLSEQQLEAVGRACRGSLTLISGEPGTGKTSIVVTILRVLARLGVPNEEIALAAPTGKAADRMRRSILRTLDSLKAPAFEDTALKKEAPESRTLHRLLGYSAATGTFRHHERNPLAERVVIVDESSMIDVAMIDRLLRALADDAQLVLLGDAEQLPSVDAGAVFRDLCRALQSENVVRLDQSYRMDPKDPSGRHVLVTARQIQGGDPAPLFKPRGVRPRARPDDLELAGVEHLTSDLDAFLTWWKRRFSVPMEWVERRWSVDRHGLFEKASEEDLGALFRESERGRILCLTRARSTGVHAVNERFHRRALEERGLPSSVRFAVGEPVLVMRNDYERGLFNGDQGVVLWVESPRNGQRPCAVFRRAEGFVAFPMESLAATVELAHAVTVHKAQGSEHDNVAVVLPTEVIPLLTRELLYTAVTRARKGVVLLGAQELIEYAVRSRVERSSGLSDFLQEEL
ncbi:MAG: AAA family ATPase [Myxococcota bacterium]